MNTQRLLISTQDNFCCDKEEIAKAGKFDILTFQRGNCIGQIIIINNNDQANQNYRKVLKNTSHFNRIETFMTNVSITGECTTSMEQFGKGFCLSMVHSGVNKMLSNDAMIEN